MIGSRSAVAKDQGMRRGDATKMSERICCENGNILCHDCGGGHTTESICQSILNCILKIGNFSKCKLYMRESPGNILYVAPAEDLFLI